MSALKKEWRKHIDSETRKHMDKLVLTSSNHKHHYKDSDNPAIAQLWIALAELSKRIEQIESKFPKEKTDRKKLIRDLEVW